MDKVLHVKGECIIMMMWNLFQLQRVHVLKFKYFKQGIYMNDHTTNLDTQKSLMTNICFIFLQHVLAFVAILREIN